MGANRIVGCSTTCFLACWLVLDGLGCRQIAGYDGSGLFEQPDSGEPGADGSGGGEPDASGGGEPDADSGEIPDRGAVGDAEAEEDGASPMGDALADASSGSEAEAAVVVRDAGPDISTGLDAEPDVSDAASSCPDPAPTHLCSTAAGASFVTCSAADATPVAPATLLYDFDPLDGGVSGWVGTPAPGQASGGGTAEVVMDDFDPCGERAGALKFTTMFASYDDAGVSTGARVRVLFNIDQDWSNKKRMHLWLKLATPAPSLGSLVLMLSNRSGGAFYDTLAPSAIGDGSWHELVVTFAGATFLANTAQIGVILAPVNRQADAGVTPDPVVIYLDNVWIE